MASKLDIEQLSHDLGRKEFRFTFSEASEGVLVIYHAPKGWKQYAINYTRHETYNSVLRKAAKLDLIFFKEAKVFLQNVYENTGPEANVTFTAERLNLSNDTYELFPAPSKVTFSQYKVNEIRVVVKLVDDDFKEKVFNREDNEVDVLKRVSIDGLTLATFPINEITMPDTSLENADTATITGAAGATGLSVVSIGGVTNADFAEMQVPTTTTVDVKTSAFFKESASARLIRLTGTVSMDLYRGPDGSVEYTIVQVDSANVVKNRFTLLPTPPTALDTLVDLAGPIVITVNQFITLAEGDSLILQSNLVGGNTVLSGGAIVVNETFEGSPEATITALMDYETGLSVSQLITDLPNPFHSDFFGRTDTPLTVYDADGELGAVTKGILFRDSNSNSNTIPLTLKKWFNSKSSTFRLGLGIETIDGVKKIRVEGMDHFFPATVVLDISDRLREEDIEKEAIPERLYRSLTFGYKKFEYDATAGQLEFNTKSVWTTIIKSVFTELKHIIDYRGDYQGMVNILRAPLQGDYDATKDVKGDDDIFLIDCVRSGGGFIARTKEGFDFIGGAVNADKSFNVNWSPTRNLLRWGPIIRSALMKALNSTLRWQSTEKNNTLQSRLSTESTTVEENANIIVNDLEAPRFHPEMYPVKVPITNAELNLIEANPNGLFKLADTKYGWILEADYELEDGKIELNLLRANLDVVEPV